MGRRSRPASLAGVELDLSDFTGDPYAVFADLRAAGPVHRVRLHPGRPVWLVVGHDEVRAGLMDETLTKVPPGADPAELGRNMLTADPPDHTRLRRLVSRAFTARSVQGLGRRTEEMAAALLRDLAGDGSADLLTAYALPIATGVITAMLGVPDLDRDRFRAWCDAVIVPPGDVTETLRIRDELLGYFEQLIERKRRNPAGDLLSQMIEVTDGDRMTYEELRSTLFLLLIAGQETTVNLVGNGVLTLLRHPERLAALTADWALLDRTVEEILRFEGPLLFSTARFTTTDYRVGEVVVPAGEPVMFALSSANRDPGRFGRADRFDPGRAPEPHLAFGHGIHHCLGAPLARVTGGAALRTLFSTLPSLALTAEEPAWRPSATTRGLTRLPVTWEVTTFKSE